MKKISLIVASTLVMLLASGCSTKDVGYDDSSAKQESSAEEQVQRDTKAETSLVERDKVSIGDKLAYINVVTSNIDGKDISLRSVHFAFDKYNLTDTMRAIEKENYEIISPLVSDNASIKIKLEGNCDEWGTDEYNYALGLKRAKIVKDALVSDGILADKITLISFGESNPLCTDKSEMCWKKNRRVDHKLLP